MIKNFDEKLTHLFLGLIDEKYIGATVQYIREGHRLRCKLRSAVAGVADGEVDEESVEALIKALEFDIAQSDYEQNKEVYDGLTAKCEELISIASDPAKQAKLAAEEIAVLANDPVKKMEFVNFLREQAKMSNEEIAEYLRFLGI